MRSIDEIFEIEGGPVHHAYLVLGDTEELFQRVSLCAESFLQKKGEGLSELVKIKKEVFSVDDARKIKKSGSETAFSKDPLRFFVLAANIFTEEASNALLKTIEEPLAGHHYFIITGNEDRVPGTLISRTKIIKPKSSTDSTIYKIALDFASAGVVDRLEIAEEKMPKDDNDNISRTFVVSFLENLQRIYFDQYKNYDLKLKTNLAKNIDNISDCIKYLGNPASSPKLMLEYISFSLSTIE